MCLHYSICKAVLLHFLSPCWQLDMDTLWLDVATPLLSALLGGLLVALPSIWATVRADRQRRWNVASAFRGEIGSVLHLYETRGYLAFHQDRLATWMSNDVPVTFPKDFDERQYDRIYDTLASDIGALPEPVPERLVTFYMLLDAVHEDLGENEPGGSTSSHGRQSWHSISTLWV